MTSRLIGTVAAHRKILLGGERGQQCDQSLRPRLAHLGAIATLECCPAFGGKRRGASPGDQCRARSQLRNPNIVVVASPQVVFAHSPRRVAHGSEPEALPTLARCPEAYDADSQVSPPGESGRGQLSRSEAPRRLGATSRYASRSRSFRSSQATAPSSHTPTQPLGPT